MWKPLLAVVSLVGCGIQAGALLMFLFGVGPTLRSIGVPEWMRIHVSLDRSIEKYMPVLNLVTGGSSLVLLFFAQPPQARWFRVAGLVANIGLAVISETANVPLNKRIARRLPALATGGTTGSADAGAEDMAAVRTRWMDWHRVRTLTISLGFLCYAVGFALDNG
jgi:uncharacterized membrane protein